MKQKLLAFILALSMAMQCGGALAGNLTADGTAEAEQNSAAQVIRDKVIFLNPLYEGIVTEDDLTTASTVRGKSVQAETEPVYSASISELGDQVREKLDARAQKITIYYQGEAYNQAVMTDIFEEAIRHTGVAREGDYLRWQYAGWEGTMSGYVEGMTYYLTLTYTVTYYTSAEQEAEVDIAIADIRKQLELDGKSDYEKICSIYDYICNTVTYDNEHLSDDSYKRKYTVYAAVFDKTAVCQGYALLFYRLVMEEGIDCRFISGMGNGVSHGWNIVKLGNYYYNVDSTWDSESTSYQYFLQCNESFEGHTREASYTTEAFYQSYPMDTMDYAQRLKNHSHSYGQPEFSWSADLHSCTAVWGCTLGDVVTKIDCAVSSEETKAPGCAEAGEITYTAAAGLGGRRYTDTKTSMAAALGHTYGKPQFTWSADLSSCTAAFTCTRCGEVVTETCEVSKDTIPAKCFEDGSLTAVAKVTINGETYTDQQTIVLDATGHVYDEPEFCWNEDYTTCAAVFTCINGDDTQEITCTVERAETEPTCETEGAVVYTAEAEFDGKTYTNIKRDSIAALGHDYQEPVFLWPDDLSFCTAAFVCSQCGKIQNEVCSVTHDIIPASCTENGIIYAEASVTFEEQTYTGQKSAILPATGHIYNQPEFRWNEDYTACTAVFTCIGGDDTQEISCTVTSMVTLPTCTDEGNILYTAGVEYGGKSYTDQQILTAKALEHTYGEPEFQWSKDFTSCTAVFTCSVCGHTESVACTVSEDPTGKTAACTLEGKSYTKHIENSTPRVEDVFTDVSATAWYRPYVQYVYDNKIMSGMSSTVFSPGSSLTRAQIVQILYNYRGKPEVNGKMPFSDVKKQRWYYNAVLWGSINHVVSGMTDGTFRPENDVTRQELAVILYNYAGRPEVSGSLDTVFSDSKSIARWASDAVLWAYQNGIVSGIKSGNSVRFNPKGNATRAEAATMVTNYLK
ncbi:MAG: S-layer homology domain-containing protein [Clostridia bacterium]|nr:S-layer homology domain-containing protein [Clostridia bacterium]